MIASCGLLTFPHYQVVHRKFCTPLLDWKLRRPCFCFWQQNKKKNVIDFSQRKQNFTPATLLTGKSETLSCSKSLSSWSPFKAAGITSSTSPKIFQSNTWTKIFTLIQKWFACCRWHERAAWQKKKTFAGRRRTRWQTAESKPVWQADWRAHRLRPSRMPTKSSVTRQNQSADRHGRSVCVCCMCAYDIIIIVNECLRYVCKRLMGFYTPLAQWTEVPGSLHTHTHTGPITHSSPYLPHTHFLLPCSCEMWASHHLMNKMSVFFGGVFFLLLNVAAVSENSGKSKMKRGCALSSPSQ